MPDFNLTKLIMQELTQLGFNNVIADTFPAEPVDSIVVKKGEGLSTFQSDKTGDNNPTFTIYVRNSNYQQAEAICGEIAYKLDRRYGYWLSDTVFVMQSEKLSEPASLGMDEQGHFRFNCNFHLQLVSY